VAEDTVVVLVTELTVVVVVVEEAFEEGEPDGKKGRNMRRHKMSPTAREPLEAIPSVKTGQSNLRLALIRNVDSGVGAWNIYLKFISDYNSGNPASHRPGILLSKRRGLSQWLTDHPETCLFCRLCSVCRTSSGFTL
jgi:hypothetical protein